LNEFKKKRKASDLDDDGEHPAKRQRISARKSGKKLKKEDIAKKSQNEHFQNNNKNNANNDKNNANNDKK